MPRPLRTLAALTVGAVGAAGAAAVGAAARNARRAAAPGEPEAAPPAVAPAPVGVAPAPPAPRPAPPPPPVRARRPPWVWVAHLLGWPLGLGVFLGLGGGLLLSAVWGVDAVSHAEWFLWGSIGVMPVGGVLLWLAARDDEEREERYAWAVATWQARHGRGVGDADGTTSGYGSSAHVADPTYGAAWGGGYAGGYDGGSSYDGGGYSGGSDGGGGGGYSSSY